MLHFLGTGGRRFDTFEGWHWRTDCFLCLSCRQSLIENEVITESESVKIGSLVHCTPTRCTRSILPTSTLTTYTLPSFILHTSALHTMHYAHRWFALLGLPTSTLHTRGFAYIALLDNYRHKRSNLNNHSAQNTL